MRTIHSYREVKQYKQCMWNTCFDVGMKNFRFFDAVIRCSTYDALHRLMIAALKKEFHSFQTLRSCGSNPFGTHILVSEGSHLLERIYLLTDDRQIRFCMTLVSATLQIEHTKKPIEFISDQFFFFQFIFSHLFFIISSFSSTFYEGRTETYILLLV